MRKSVAPGKAKRGQVVRRELLRIEDNVVPITLRMNPRARRLIVRVHPSTGEVTVVAPSRRALDHALDFARGETAWIAEKLAEVPAPVPVAPGAQILYRGEDYRIEAASAGPAPVWADDDAKIIYVTGKVEHAPRRVMDFLKREARTMLDVRTNHYAAQIALRPKRITVRDTTTRWGSCSTGRSLSFSWRLIMAPPFVLDYVVAHEVAHMRQMNHAPRFWRLLGTMIDDVDAPQRWLNDNGTLLHRYAPRTENVK